MQEVKSLARKIRKADERWKYAESIAEAESRLAGNPPREYGQVQSQVTVDRFLKALESLSPEQRKQVEDALKKI